ncbi:MAG: L-seryl-tRNA(Sec) selenium transferase [Syntrophales bacterium]|nr:L-seryl-tRNA(Sec) selenium transferase [Syntrophales bacterium]
MMDDHRKELLKHLPKIDDVLLVLEKQGLFERTAKEIVKEVGRAVVGDLREHILSGKEDLTEWRMPLIEQVADRVRGRAKLLHQPRLRRVVNATGIILHTNLGRSPLCPQAVAAIVEVSRGYSNLEFDLQQGRRGLRYDHVQGILCTLTGAEDALVVNNNAAAVLLVLNTLAAGREAIVSRGELIEIGGEFRIPEVMEKSGARLREVGATNRTHLKDYEKAISGETGLILKVHTSNYKIVGFTEEIALPALVALGKKHGVPVMDDLGSGCLIDLNRYGLEREPTVADTLLTGVDVVTFSGDKLLGGPQAGIILGKREILRKIKNNPLNRALRIDKLTLAALEATLIQYLNPETALSEIRTLRALVAPASAMAQMARRLLGGLRRLNLAGFTFSLQKGVSLAGGGSLPTQEIPTALISVRSASLPVNKIEERLRQLDVPIIARIVDDALLLDLRTIAEEEFALIKKGFQTFRES